MDVNPQKITTENFSDYGFVTSISQPDGYYLEGEYHKFFRDPVRMITQSGSLGLSSLVVRKNEGLKIKAMEYHDETDELQLPLDADVLLAVAPANGGEIIEAEVEVFQVPKGMLVILKEGTWHDVMYPISEEQVHVLIGLPERTYKKDIVVKKISEEIQIIL